MVGLEHQNVKIAVKKGVVFGDVRSYPLKTDVEVWEGFKQSVVYLTG